MAYLGMRVQLWVAVLYIALSWVSRPLVGDCMGTSPHDGAKARSFDPRNAQDAAAKERSAGHRRVKTEMAAARGGGGTDRARHRASKRTKAAASVLQRAPISRVINDCELAAVGPARPSPAKCGSAGRRRGGHRKDRGVRGKGIWQKLGARASEVCARESLGRAAAPMRTPARWDGW